MTTSARKQLACCSLLKKNSLALALLLACLTHTQLEATTKIESEIQNLQQEIAKKKQTIDAYRKSVQSVQRSRKTALQNYIRSKKKSLPCEKK